jgi:hypothetical protein
MLELARRLSQISVSSFRTPSLKRNSRIHPAQRSSRAKLTVRLLVFRKTLCVRRKPLQETAPRRPEIGKGLSPDFLPFVPFVDVHMQTFSK